MNQPTSARRPARRWKVLGVVLIGVLAGLAGLPWALSVGPGRSRVAAGLNRALAPGRLRFEELHLSWFGPTRVSRVALLDPRGEAVVEAPSAVLDRSLAQILLGVRGPATLRIEGASIEIERRPDGSLNVVDALRSVLANPDPGRDVTIRVAEGSLRYRDPFLAEPLVADAVDLTIRAPSAPSPVNWSLKLGRGEAGLEARGDFDAWLAKGGPPRTPELTVGVVGKRWPFVARTASVDASGRLDGSLDFARRRGRWVFSGDARLIGLKARGQGLAGDTLAFDRLEAGWDVAEGEEGWTIRRLSASGPPGQIKAEGQLNGADGSGTQRIEGRLDLAEIARQIPHALRLRDGLTVDRGTARVAVDLTTGPGRSTFEIEARVSNLAARDRDRALSLKDPATFTAQLVRRGDESTVERLSVVTPFLNATAKGRLEDGVELEGSVDLGGLSKQLGEWVDLGALDLSGRADLAGTYRIFPAGISTEIEDEASSALGEPITGPHPVARPARYINRLAATFRDLRVEGTAAGPIRRDSASLQSYATGPILPSGWPRDWSTVTLRASSGGTEARLGLEARGGPIGVYATALSQSIAGQSSRSAQARLAAERSADGRILTIGRLSLAMLRKDGPPEAHLTAAARGHLDLSGGDLILEAAPKAQPGAIVIDPDGLRVSGLGRGLGALRVDGGLSGELAALDHLLSDLAGRPPLGLSGRWSALGNARGDVDGVQVAGRFGIDGPTPRGGRPTGLAIRAHYSPRADRVDLTEFTVSGGYGTVDASGTLEGATLGRRLDLKGVVSPDFGAITALMAAKVEPGAKLEGRPRAFRAVGPIGPGVWKGLDAELGFDLVAADVWGLKLGPTPVVARLGGGKLAFDPISTSLNEGHIRLEPEVDLDARGGPVLRLAKNSAIREARINDEVSRRFLAFVAPILDQATRATGLVSVDLDHAEFPIGPGRGRQVKVEGAVVFEDVEFGPGPLAAEILGAIGRRDLTLKLDQPVTLTVADGRVNQRGMAIPVGDLTRIELAGWVDFDRNLALSATVPVTPAMLGNNPLLSDIAAGTSVRLPIGGTLDRPRVDRNAFAANLQDLGKSLLTRGATRGAMELLMRLGRPRDPDSPPPPPRPTPEERKAMRQEKKAIRRGEIPPPPPQPAVPRP